MAAQGGEVEQVRVGQLRRAHVGQGAGDGFAAAGAFLFPGGQHAGHLLALQVFLRAAQGAGNDGELLEVRVGHQVGFAAGRQRPDDHVLAVVAEQLGRHAGQPGVEEQVHEERGQQVVAVVAERDLGETIFPGVPVQRAAAQARAQRAHGLAFGHHALDHRIGVLLDDRERHADRAQVVGQHVFRETGLLLVEVHRHQLEAHRRLLLQLQQQVEQGVAVLAARQADHDLVAVFDHAVVGDGLADLPAQALGQFGALMRLPARDAFGRRLAGQRIVQDQGHGGVWNDGETVAHSTPVARPAGALG